MMSEMLRMQRFTNGTLWYICKPDEYLYSVLQITIIIMVVDAKTLIKYKCILASFMSFLHDRPVGSEYP